MTSSHPARAAELARARGLRLDEEMLYVQLDDGREVGVPIAWFPRLADATKEQRGRWEFIGRGVGIHWPDVDEDISVAALLAQPV
jgi:Protein of unknown function (DUF2442)